MRHLASPSFWELFEKLPGSIKDLATKNFELLKRNPLHPSLHFKNIGRFRSVRIGQHYRALAVEAMLEFSGSGSELMHNKIDSLCNTISKPISALPPTPDKRLRQGWRGG